MAREDVGSRERERERLSRERWAWLLDFRVERLPLGRAGWSKCRGRAGLGECLVRSRMAATVFAWEVTVKDRRKGLAWWLTRIIMLF